MCFVFLFGCYMIAYAILLVSDYPIFVFELYSKYLPILFLLVGILDAVEYYFRIKHLAKKDNNG